MLSRAVMIRDFGLEYLRHKVVDDCDSLGWLSAAECPPCASLEVAMHRIL